MLSVFETEGWRFEPVRARHSTRWYYWRSNCSRHGPAGHGKELNGVKTPTKPAKSPTEIPTDVRASFAPPHSPYYVYYLWSEAMSKGPGRVMRLINEAIESEPKRRFTFEELAAITYGSPVARSRLVAVRRAVQALVSANFCVLAQK
jgi:hypothetical protein